jgi:hypothetical protein
MSNFVQSTEYDAYMYAKFEYFDVHIFFINKYFKIWVIIILQEAI